MTVPETIEDCDREIREYQKAMKLVTIDGRVAVWEQIDRILEIRHGLQEKDFGASANIRADGEAT